MASKTINLLLGIVILAIILPENELAEGPPEPMNRLIKGIGAVKCLVYMWEGLCSPANCTVEINAKLTKPGGSALTLSKATLQAPVTKGNKQGVCFKDEGIPRSCCDMIFNGTTKGWQEVDSFGDYERMDVDIKRTQFGVSKTWSNKMMVLPWMMCQVPANPCNHGTCILQANSYKCNCSEGWEGEKCDVLTGFSIQMKKCLKDPPEPTKTINSTELVVCTKECKKMNTEYKLGCKSFQFGGKWHKPSKGKCEIFDVSEKVSQKTLVSCNSTYLELDILPPTKKTTTEKPTTEKPTTMSAAGLVSSFLTVVSLVVLVFLHM